MYILIYIYLLSKTRIHSLKKCSKTIRKKIVKLIKVGNIQLECSV